MITRHGLRAAGTLLACAATSVVLAATAAPAGATSSAYVERTQGACTGWGNVILSGAQYAPGVPSAPAVYGNLHDGSCANSYAPTSSAYGLEHQCTEFAVHWAASVWHVDPSQWKTSGSFVDAAQMWDQAGRITGLVRHANGSSAPVAGDLLVFKDQSVGHVAVVAGVSGDQLYFVGQNQTEAEQHISITANHVSANTASEWLGQTGAVIGWISPPSTLTPLHTAIALIPNDDAAGYTVDGFGGIHAFGGAPAVTVPSTYWRGWDIARGIAISPTSTNRAVKGYVLDGYGGIHPFAAGNATAPPTPATASYWQGWDIARGIVLSTATSGYVLDGFGGIHPFAAAGHKLPPAVVGTAYWNGWDIARGIVLSSAHTGYVLDGYGGIHSFAPAHSTLPPTVVGTAYWNGWDIARGIALVSPHTGYILDGYGGIHAFAPSGVADPPVHSPGYVNGQDLFRGIAADRATGTVVDVRAYDQDGSAGNVYSFSDRS